MHPRRDTLARRRAIIAIALAALGAAPAAGRVLSAAADVPESEPNDEIALATPIVPGDVAIGAIDPDGDIDVFVLDLADSAVLSLAFDLASAEFINIPVVELLDEVGSVLGREEGRSGLLRVFAPPGRYHVRVSDRDGIGDAGYTYSLPVEAIPLGPGDPPTTVATGLGEPLGMAAGPGVLYVADRNGRVLQVGFDGSVQGLLTGQRFDDVAVDAFGDLLALEQVEDATHRVVRRGPDGAWETFSLSSLPGTPRQLAVGPDGDLWIAVEQSTQGTQFQLRRYTAYGEFEESFLLPSGHGVVDFAFSLAGDLHWSTGTAVWRMQSSDPLRVVEFGGHIAFDEDGFLYVANGGPGEIRLFDPDYEEVGSVFAVWNVEDAADLAFARNPDGSMAARLFMVSGTFAANAGNLVEVNPDGVRAPGLRVGTDLLRILTGQLPEGVMGTAYEAPLEHGGGVAASWSLQEGELPAGLQVLPQGRIAGIPEESGSFPITVRAEGGGLFGFRTMELVVTRPEVRLEAVVDRVLGDPAALSEVESGFVDVVGNGNGRVDVGDLQALVRSGEALPSARPADRSGSSASREEGR